MDRCPYLKHYPQIKTGPLASPEDWDCEYQRSIHYKHRSASEQELVDWILEYIEYDCSKCPFEEEGEDN